MSQSCVSTGTQFTTWYDQYSAHYAWDVGQQPAEDTIDQSVVNRVTPPSVALPPGRYEIEDADLVMEIFPQGAIRVHYNNETLWMHLDSNSSTSFWARRYTAYPGGLHIYFQPTDGDLRISTGSSTVWSGTVTVEHRVG